MNKRLSPRADVTLILSGSLWQFAITPRRSVSYRFPQIRVLDRPGGVCSEDCNSASSADELLALLPEAVAEESSFWLQTIQLLADGSTLADSCGWTGRNASLIETVQFALSHINPDSLAWMGLCSDVARPASVGDAKAAFDVILNGRIERYDGQYLTYEIRRDIGADSGSQTSLTTAGRDDNPTDSTGGVVDRIVQRGALSIQYQPILPTRQLRAGTRSACEAIVNWEHPDSGILSAAQLYRAAEQRQVLFPVAQRILDAVIDQITELEASGCSCEVNLALPLSLFNDQKFPDWLAGRWQSSEVVRASLSLTLGDRRLLEAEPEVIGALIWLSKQGVQTGVRDSGFGGRTLTRLKGVPLSELIFCRRFTRQVSSNHRALNIAQSTARLAHGFGLNVVADGVDDSGLQPVLELLECDRILGSMVAFPMPGRDLPGYFATKSRAAIVA